MPTFTVSTAAELSAALANAPANSTILLAAGHYGDLRLQNSDITLQAADMSNPPVFNTMVIDGGSNLDFVGLKIDFQPTATSMSWDAAVRVINNADGVTFDQMMFQGNPAVNGVPATSTSLDSTGNILGAPTGRAISITNADNITVSNSEITGFQHGIRGGNGDGLNIINNYIHHLRGSPIGGGNFDDIVIDGNHMASIHPWSLGGSGDHADIIHFWTDPNAQNTASKNVTITNNFFDQGTGTSPILGIYLDDNGNNLGFQNVDISNNVIRNGDHQGIRLENVDGGTITYNTLLSTGNTTNEAPAIHVKPGSSNLQIHHNITPYVDVDPATSGINVGTNMVAQRTSPDQAFYYSDLFVNAFSGQVTLEDLQLLPGSPLAGFGAAQTQFDTAPSVLTPLLISQEGQGLALNHFNMDLAAIYGPSGQLNLAGAQVAWDFGDGTTGSGLNANHVYTTAGAYDVTATITLANGQTIVADKSVVARTPILLAASFENGAQDLSDIQNTALTNGAIQFVTDQGDKALRLNGGTVAFGRSAELRDNDSYTVMIDFRKDAPGQTGRLITYAGSLVVQANADQIIVGVTTSMGTKWIKASGIGIYDTNWHKLALTFSGATGEAILYMDGTEVGKATGLTGAVQTGIASHDFYLGSPTGSSFGGLMDDVYMLSGALDAGQIGAINAGTQTVTSILQLGIADPNTLNNGTSGGLGTGTSGTTGTGTGTTTTGDTGSSTGGNTDTGSNQNTSGTNTDTGSGDTTGQTGGETTQTGDTTTQTGGEGQSDGSTSGQAQLVDEDKGVIRIDSRISQDRIQVDPTNSQIKIDQDGDGILDQTINLTGDFSAGEFMTSYAPDQTLVVFQNHLTGLINSKAASATQINGIANTAYLSGDNASSFAVTMRHDISAAGFDNSLGVYEYDDQGNISDVRMIVQNVSNETGTITVNGVDAGKGLGFFLVQNGYNRLDKDVLGSTDLSLSVKNGAIRLADEGQIVKGAKVFVSHDASLNFDGMEHVVSGADPSGLGGLLIGFEDQNRNGLNGDDDFQDVVLHIEAMHSGVTDFI